MGLNLFLLICWLVCISSQSNLTTDSNQNQSLTLQQQQQSQSTESIESQQPNSYYLQHANYRVKFRKGSPQTYLTKQQQQTQYQQEQQLETKLDRTIIGAIVIGSIFLFITLSITITVIIFCLKKNTVFVFQKSEQDDITGDYSPEALSSYNLSQYDHPNVIVPSLMHPPHTCCHHQLYHHGNSTIIRPRPSELALWHKLNENKPFKPLFTTTTSSSADGKPFVITTKHSTMPKHNKQQQHKNIQIQFNCIDNKRHVDLNARDQTSQEHYKSLFPDLQHPLLINSEPKPSQMIKSTSTITELKQLTLVNPQSSTESPQHKILSNNNSNNKISKSQSVIETSIKDLA